MSADEEVPEDTLGRLVGTVAAYVVIGFLMLAVVDGLFALLGGGRFGQISGWIAAIMSVFAFTDQFRRYADVGARWAVAALGVVLGLGAGAAATLFLPVTWVPLVTGAVGGLTAALVYAVVWYAGVRTFGEERA
jgi:hypothetical protein